MQPPPSLTQRGIVKGLPGPYAAGIMPLDLSDDEKRAIITSSPAPTDNNCARPLLRRADPMERRSFIVMTLALAEWPLAGSAQQKAMPVIGQLSAFSPPANLGDLLRGSIRQGMGEMGFVEGQNMAWEYRWADFHYDRLPALAADLVSRKVDLIVTTGGAPPALAAKTQPRRSRSSSPTSATQWGPAWSPVSLGRAATSPASAISLGSWSPSGSSCFASWFPSPR